MYIACVSFHSLTDEQEVMPRDDAPANHVTAALTSRLLHLQASFVCSQLRIQMKREIIDSSIAILHTKTVLLSNSGFPVGGALHASKDAFHGTVNKVKASHQQTPY